MAVIGATGFIRLCMPRPVMGLDRRSGARSPGLRRPACTMATSNSDEEGDVVRRATVGPDVLFGGLADAGEGALLARDRDRLGADL